MTYISLSLLWLLVGLMVVYKIGIGDIIASIGMESAAGESPGEMNDSFTYAVYLFLVVLMWPIIWIEYLNINN